MSATAEFLTKVTSPFAAHDYVYLDDPILGGDKKRSRIVWIEHDDVMNSDEVMLAIPGEDDLTPVEGFDQLTRCFPKIRVTEAEYGLGVFAAAPIKKGDLILEEKPLLTATRDGEAEMIYYDLPVPTQMAIMGLNDPECTGESGNEHLDYAMVDGFQRGDKNASTKKIRTTQEKTVGSLYRNNSIPNGAGLNVPTGSLYETMCRLNHSCTPNVQWRWVPELEEEHLYAVVDIPVGEELRASYVSEYLKPEERKDRLMKHFYFECICPLCTGKGLTEEGTLRYETGLKIHSLLKSVEKRVEALPHYSTTSNTGASGEAALKSLGTEISLLIREARELCGTAVHLYYERKRLDDAEVALQRRLSY